MSNQQVTCALNRLLEAQRFSLADYLHEARPWAGSGDEGKLAVIEQIVADHEYYAHRLANAIGETGGTIDGGCFPMRFTSLNDLSLEFLLPRLVDAQRQAIAEIESCVADLRGHAMFFSLAEEVLGAAKGHLGNLLEASGQGNGGTGERREYLVAA